jgi:EAL domain-containing protein (putative c-di-GMP-specific phosphodiesterase class I)
VLRTHFQPIVDIARGTVVGYEALARFDGPRHVTPRPLVRRRARRGHGRRSRGAGPPQCAAGPARAAAQLLPVRQRRPDALLSAPVRAVLAEAGDLRGVVVEITEQTAVTDYERPGGGDGARRVPGALLAVDDAGAGSRRSSTSCCCGRTS